MISTVKYNHIQSLRTRSIIQLAYDEATGLKELGKLNRAIARNRIATLILMLDLYMVDAERSDAIERINYAFERYVKL